MSNEDNSDIIRIEIRPLYVEIRTIVTHPTPIFPLSVGILICLLESKSASTLNG